MQHVAAVAGEESDARVGKSSGIGLGVDGCRWRLGWLSSPTHGVGVPRRDLPSHEEEVDDDTQWASWAAYLLRSRRMLRRVRAARPGSPLG